MTSYIQGGRAAVRPYIYGHFELPEFVVEVFGATEIERHSFGERKAHVELELDDSVIVIEAGDFDPSQNASIYVYVPDVDAAYARALAAGGTSESEPVDREFGERLAGIKDAFGNTWWISTVIRKG